MPGIGNATYQQMKIRGNQQTFTITCAHCGTTQAKPLHRKRMGQTHYYCNKSCEIAYKREHRVLETWW